MCGPGLFDGVCGGLPDHRVERQALARLHEHGPQIPLDRGAWPAQPGSKHLRSGSKNTDRPAVAPPPPVPPTCPDTPPAAVLPTESRSCLWPRARWPRLPWGRETRPSFTFTPERELRANAEPLRHCPFRRCLFRRNCKSVSYSFFVHERSTSNGAQRGNASFSLRPLSPHIVPELSLRQGILQKIVPFTQG